MNSDPFVVATLHLRIDFELLATHLCVVHEAGRQLGREVPLVKTICGWRDREGNPIPLAAYLKLPG